MPRLLNTPGTGGTQDAPDLQRSGKRRCMDRPVPAKRHEREAAGIEPAFGGYGPQRPSHGGVCDPVNPPRHLHDGKAERAPHLRLQHARGERRVDPQAAAREPFGVDQSEHHIGVRHGGLATAEAVAGWAGDGTRAVRPDA